MDQKENNRLGFFRRAILAMTDFRVYPFVQREKISAAVAYFTLLMVFVTIFISFYFSNSFLKGISNILYNYDIIPEFNCENGMLNVEEKIYDLKSQMRFVVDTSYTNKEFIETDVGKEMINSNMFVALNSDGVIYGNKEGNGRFLYSNLNTDLDRNGLYLYLKTIADDWTIKSAVVSVTWLCTFVVYYILKTLNVLFYMLIAWIFNMFFGIKLKPNNYYKIIVYALTLPLLVEMFSILYLGRIPEYATIVYQLLACIYIFYALRAIKLDIILISTPGGNFKEKIENMIQKLENEIEENIKNQAETENKEENLKNEDNSQEQKDNNDEKEE